MRTPRTPMQRLSRLGAVAALALALGGATGCNEIWAELDGEPIGAQKPAKAKKEQAEAGAPPQSPQAKLEQYYEDQRRAKRAPDFDPDNTIITCELEGRRVMTRRFDCLSQGGRVR